MNTAAALNLAALRREFVAGDELLPYEYHYSNYSIKTTNDTLIRIYAVRGLLFETADNDQINAWHNQLCQSLLSIGISSPNAAIWHWLIKEEDHCNNSSSFAQPFSAEFLKTYADQINTNKFYQTRIFLAVCIRSPFRVPKFSRNKLVDSARAAALRECEDKLEEITAELSQLPHGIDVLGTYQHGNITYSGALEVLFRLLNGYWTPVPLYTANINTYLTTSRFNSGKDVFEIRTPTEQIYGAALGFRQYLDETNPLTLQNILHLNFPILLAQSFSFERSDKAMGELSRQLRQMSFSKDAPESYIQALETAKEQLKSNAIMFGEHHLSLFVYAHANDEDSPDHLKRRLTDRISQASSALSQAGIIVAREDLALPSAYYAALPCNHEYRPRVARIHSRNMASFMPLHTTPIGSDNNHWTTRDDRHEALLAFRNSSGGLYRFNPHIGDLGHSLIIGTSGSGKTVLMGALTSQFDKYDARVFVCDKDCGQEILIRTLGGEYHNIIRGEPSGLNPYALEPTPGNINFLTAFTLRLAYPNNDYQPQQENELNQHLRHWYANKNLPGHLRRISELRNGLQDYEIKDRLLKWTNAGANGWLFDNAEDTFDFTTPQFVGIDTTDILDDNIAKTPFFMYLTHRMTEALDGRRTVLALDELWKMLDDPYFEGMIKDWLKTLRKKNALLIGATQDAADIANSNISSTLLTQCQTRIFYANPLAKVADYKPFALTDNEFHFVKNANPNYRMLLIKQENGSVLVNFKLNAMERQIAVISGRTSNLKVMRDCIREVGKNPDDWLPLFYERYTME